jgi:predicted O-methyltransferase YrrM
MQKTLPRPSSQYAALSELSYGPVKWELLKTAIELKVFDLLHQPASAEDISHALSSHLKNTEYFLKALVALGWLSHYDNMYCNTDLPETYLTPGKDTYLGDFLLFMSGWSRSLLDGGIKKLVKNGPAKQANIGDEKIWEYGARATVNFSRCGRAQLIAKEISTLPEFPSFKKMLDLGGGPGIIAIATAAIHPTLQGIVFEQKAVTPVADEVIAEYGLSDRIHTLGGNYMQDDIGQGYDLVMANFTLNFYRAHLDDILTKVHNALNPGGIFLIMDDGLNHDKTGPELSVLSWLSTCLQQDNMMFDNNELDQALLRVGFSSTQRHIIDNPALDGGHGAVRFLIGRRAAA